LNNDNIITITSVLREKKEKAWQEYLKTLSKALSITGKITFPKEAEVAYQKYLSAKNNYNDSLARSIGNGDI